MNHDFFNHDVVAKLGGIPLEARQPMLGNVSGRHRSPHRGSSVEFAEYRKYVAGDDTRRLDWKAYARSDRYYIKEFEADTNLRLYLVIDTSGSMGFSHTHGSKLRYAYALGSALAYLAINQGDSSGLLLCKQGGDIDIPPSRRPIHLQVMFEQMSKAEAQGQTNVVDALHMLAEKVQQRALVLVVSDLFCDTEALSDALQHLKYRKHDVAVFHLMDELELNFDFERPMRFVDMEDGTNIVAEPSLIAEDYLAALKEFLSEVKEKCHDAAVDYNLVRTSQNLEDVLRDFLIARLPKKGKV